MLYEGKKRIDNNFICQVRETDLSIRLLCWFFFNFGWLRSDFLVCFELKINSGSNLDLILESICIHWFVECFDSYTISKYLANWPLGYNIYDNWRWKYRATGKLSSSDALKHYASILRKNFQIFLAHKFIYVKLQRNLFRIVNILTSLTKNAWKYWEKWYLLFFYVVYSNVNICCQRCTYSNYTSLTKKKKK